MFSNSFSGGFLMREYILLGYIGLYTLYIFFDDNLQCISLR